MIKKAKTRKRVSTKLRNPVRRRAKGYCEYCTCPEFCATQLHSTEHILPKSHGGPDEQSNLALACQGCNGAKFDKTHAIDPATGLSVPLFHPRLDDWHKHFAWAPDYLYLVGLTPTGRSTIRELGLNRTGVVKLRRLLLLNNEHPPAHRSNR